MGSRRVIRHPSRGPRPQRSPFFEDPSKARPLVQCPVGYIQRSLAIDKVGQLGPTGGACLSPGPLYAISVGHRSFGGSPLQLADFNVLPVRSVPCSMGDQPMSSARVYVQVKSGKVGGRGLQTRKMNS